VAGPTGAVTSRRIAPTGLPRRPRLPGARPARGAGVAAAADAVARARAGLLEIGGAAPLPPVPS